MVQLIDPLGILRGVFRNIPIIFIYICVNIYISHLSFKIKILRD